MAPTKTSAHEIDRTVNITKSSTVEIPLLPRAPLPRQELRTLGPNTRPGHDSRLRLYLPKISLPNRLPRPDKQGGAERLELARIQSACERFAPTPATSLRFFVRL